MAAWKTIHGAAATAKQRRTLHRFRVAVETIDRLDRDQAAALIGTLVKIAEENKSEDFFVQEEGIESVDVEIK